MALSLLGTDRCCFEKCGLCFANHNDLILHIEEAHIPGYEEMVRRKGEIVKRAGFNQEKKQAPPTAACPLSSVLRLFSTLPSQQVRPVNPEPTKIVFCNYKKKPLLSAVTNLNAYGQSNIADKLLMRKEPDEEANLSKIEDAIDSEQCEAVDERRHKCPVEGCNKRYKNLQGAKYHAKQVHGYVDDSAIANSANFDLTPVVAGQYTQLLQPSAQSKCANTRPYKCSQCSKRYKTIAGLNNHVQHSHQRVSTKERYKFTANSSTASLVPMSPSVSYGQTNITASPATSSAHISAQSICSVTTSSINHPCSPHITNSGVSSSRMSTQQVQAVSSQQLHQYPVQATTKLVATGNSPQFRSVSAMPSHLTHLNEQQ